ncbi:MAG: hypothetical protein SF097_26710 [Acidobacteriota bacterium]|nr:hypothetical protein [Acidobacteriota bacterium]
MEEITKDLTDSEKLNLILAELADFKIWRTKVDAFIEDRSRDTQPMLGKIHKEIADTRFEMREKFEQVDARFNKMEEQLTVVSEDAKKVARLVRAQNTVLFEAKAEWDDYGNRIFKLEELMEKREAA